MRHTLVTHLWAQPTSSLRTSSCTSRDIALSQTLMTSSATSLSLQTKTCDPSVQTDSQRTKWWSVLMARFSRLHQLMSHSRTSSQWRRRIYPILQVRIWCRRRLCLRYRTNYSMLRTRRHCSRVDLWHLQWFKLKQIIRLAQALVLVGSMPDHYLQLAATSPAKWIARSQVRRSSSKLIQTSNW